MNKLGGSSTVGSVALLVVFLVLWEWAPGWLGMPEFVLPRFSRVVEEAIKMWGEGGLIKHTLITALAVLVGLAWIYPRTYARAQERTSSLRPSNGWWPASTLGLLWLKDVRLFARDAKEWSQLLMLAALQVIYLYNMKNMPADLDVFRWAVVVIHAVLAMPVLTLIFRNYYKDVPPDIIKAAIIDSGNFWRIFAEIIVPMSGNILIVVAILQITSIWNDYLVGVTFGGLGNMPMTVNLANMVTVSTGTAAYNVDMAAALLTAIPPLVIYFLLGKFFVQGIAAGAVKG